MSEKNKEKQSRGQREVSVRQTDKPGSGPLGKQGKAESFSAEIVVGA